MVTRQRLVLVAAVMGVLLASCGGLGEATSPRATSTAAPPCAPAASAGRRSLVVDEVERTYSLQLPTRLSEPSPLVVLLHGHRGSATQITAASGLPDAATEQGYVVVVPNGLGDPARWNFDRRPDGPDDSAFLDALVEELVATACVDPARVALVGSSNGAAFAGTQACGVKAVVMVIATLPPDCPVAPPSTLTIRGTSDATVAYDGTPELVAALARDAGCRGDAVVDAPHPGVERRIYPECADGASVVLDTVDGAVHAWPGGPEAQRPDNSDAGRTYDATAEILTFLRSVLGSG